MSVRRRSRAIVVLGGVAVALFALSLFGLMGVGAPSGSVARSNAGLATAATTSCTATVQTMFSPSVVVAHAPMTVHVIVTFQAGSPAICSHSERIAMLGLPPGCGAVTSATFTCTPQVAGVFHVLTIVTALNTAGTAMDTLVVR
ncbi:MAG TPA: hypothetical protein VGP88_01245 [Thermoplasmata archaeon]|jgi:hypothetical protein|nr:hypothetical protein [Thermoplasmata archaeon]